MERYTDSEGHIHIKDGVYTTHYWQNGEVCSVDVTKKQPTPRVPERCLICEAPYRGGHACPGDRMKMGLRVFYDCGASISIFSDCSNIEFGSFHLLVKNCGGYEPVELNENGLAVWRHRKNRNLFAERSYNWCDRVIVLDETENRTIVSDTKFSTFDFSDWIPVTVEQYKKVKLKFNEI